MASAIMKKPCIKCNKGGGVTTCDGCQQTFCIKHIIEHRQELAVQLDHIGQEHDVFRRDLTQEITEHPLLIRIDEWQQESITKIQVTAEAARADVQQWIDEMKNELQKSVDKMTNEMQTCREMDDYTEIDLLKWTEEVKQLRKLLETQLNVQIIEDENPITSIPMIKIRQQQPLSHVSSIYNENSIGNDTTTCTATSVITRERFGDSVGRISVSNDGLLATCLGTFWDGSNVYGTRLYSSGRHEIHFRIENKGSHNLFFGIKTTSNDMSIQTLTSSSAYGWWELDQAIESISGHRVHNDRIVRTGDDVTLILDCDNRQIFFQHHRIHLTTTLPVQLEKCPFPWRIVVTLRSFDDHVRILS